MLSFSSLVLDAKPSLGTDSRFHIFFNLECLSLLKKISTCKHALFQTAKPHQDLFGQFCVLHKENHVFWTSSVWFQLVSCPGCVLWAVVCVSLFLYTVYASCRYHSIYIHFALNGHLGSFLPGAVMICGAKHIWKHICYRCLCKGGRVAVHRALVDSAKQFSNVVMPI